MSFNTGGKEKHEIINEFLAYAREQLPGVVLSRMCLG